MLRTTVPPVHAFLRRATSRLHQRVDQTSVLTALTTPGVTLDLYRAAMQSLKRAYEEIDCLLLENSDVCSAGVPLYAPRVPRINHDLIALSVPLDSRVQPRRRLKAPNTEAAYLGMRYVVEGAQLGSRFIYKHLQTAFGDSLAEFGSFWTPGSILQGSWPDVLKSLAQVESRKSLAAVVCSARMTFQHMDLYLRARERETR